MARWGLGRGQGGKNRKVLVSKVNVGIEMSAWPVGMGEWEEWRRTFRAAGWGIKRICCMQRRVVIEQGRWISQQQEDVPSITWGEVMSLGVARVTLSSSLAGL